VSVELDAIAARIRDNVRKRTDGDVDLAGGRKAFVGLGKLAQIAAGTKHASSDIHGVRCLVIVPENHDRDRNVVYLHGGAFCMGTPEIYLGWLSHLAVACRAEVWIPDYRLAPEHPFPAGHDDALRAWKSIQTVAALTKTRTILMGDSAGGNLALATMVRARDEGIALPAAAVLISPWLDLALEGASVVLNADRDPLVRERDTHALAKMFLNGASASDPRASPLHADLRALPPIYVQVGKDETFYDDSTRFDSRARAAGVDVKLDAFDGVLHVWHFLAGIAPEADDAIARIGAFVASH
jgi:acetyl esterase/lipase